MRKKFILEAFGENEADVIDRENAEKIEAALSDFVQTDVPLKIECEFVDEEEIRRLNSEMRGIDKVTDVLSFPELENIKGKPIKKAEHPFERRRRRAAYRLARRLREARERAGGRVQPFVLSRAELSDRPRYPALFRLRSYRRERQGENARKRGKNFRRHGHYARSVKAKDTRREKRKQ